MLIKTIISLFIVFQINFFIPCLAQSFIDFNSYNNGKLAAGLENEHQFFADIHIDKYYLTVNQTLYVDEFKYQFYQVELGKTMLKTNVFLGGLNISCTGDYRGKTFYTYLGANCEIKIMNRLKVALKAKGYVSKDQKIVLLPKVGAIIKINPDVSLFAVYGNTMFFNIKETVSDLGINFLTNRLVVNSYIEIPGKSPEIKYTRFIVSFLYIFMLKK